MEENSEPVDANNEEDEQRIQMLKRGSVCGCIFGVCPGTVF
jgi:hypothetical protein